MIGRNWRYLVPRANRTGYIGWIGHDNLGDEAMYQSIRARLARLSLPPYKNTKKTRLFERIRGGKGLFKGVLLGGGTLINAPNVLSALRSGMKRYGFGSIFGPGVIDPIFWDRVPDWEDEGAEWAETLAEVRPRTVRGPRSKALLEERGVDDVEVVGDPALGLADDAPVAKAGRGRLGVNLGTAGDLQWGEEDEILDWCVHFLDEVRARGWSATIFPVYPGDLPFIRRVVERLREPVEIFSGFSDTAESLDFLRACDVFVGVKLHSVVLAHCAYTPAFMLEYRPKCTDYMRSVGQERFLMRTDELDLERALEGLRRLADDSTRIQRQLEARIGDYRRRQEEVLRALQAEVLEIPYPRVGAHGVEPTARAEPERVQA